MERTFGSGKKLRLIIGDITRVPADAIVNAANSGLAGGGGVDGAIHRAGGPSIMEELDEIRGRIGRCPTGNAVATRAGNLPAQWVFHAVGPVYAGGHRGEASQLASCYRACLALAEERRIRTITFPSISTGAYRYPIHDAARIATGAVAAHLKRPDATLEQAVFVLFDQGAFEAYRIALERADPVEPVE